MELTLTQYVLAAAVLFLASFVQGSIGFAAGLIAIPAMTQIGLKLSEAMAVGLTASALQNIAGLVELRQEIDWHIARRPVLIRLATIPLGLLVLWRLDAIEPKQMQQVLGLIVLGVLILQLAVRVEPRDHLHPAWEWLAFASGGFFVGLCGMGGPPMVLWVMAHNWSTQKSRAFMFVLFMSSLVPQALLMIYMYGQPVLVAMLLALFSAPICYLGSYLGVKAGDVFPKPLLRKLVYATLVVVAVKALATPFWFDQTDSPAATPPTAASSP